MTRDVPQTNGCANCRDLPPLSFDFTMAFQPIVDLSTRSVYAYEALVRGLNGEGAFQILSKVTDENRYQFDQRCRVRAIELATQLNMDTYLSINILPNAIYNPASCIKITLDAAHTCEFPTDRLMFEVNEAEQVTDPKHLSGIFEEYRSRGFITAIDDFGAGHAGLSLLAEFQPHIIKLDMGLIRDIDSHKTRQAIVQGVVTTALALDIRIVAEGVETEAERDCLQEMGINLFQGYLFARPAIEQLPPINWE